MKIENICWDLDRFGFTPKKLLNRFNNTHNFRIISNSIPKSGTHLIERTLCQHSYIWRKLYPTINDENITNYGGYSNVVKKLRRGELIVTHFRFSTELNDLFKSEDIIHFLMIRDPRDVVISRSFYVTGSKKHRYHELFKNQKTQKDRIILAIKGDIVSGCPSIRERYVNYLGWLTGNSIVYKFEDLVGLSGGGSKENQEQIVHDIFDRIGFEYFDKSIINNTFSKKSPTFRKGATGKWRQYFDEEIMEVFNNTVGDMVIKYGYEEDESWLNTLKS